ncbi:hypothetical protein BSY18_4081 (plasmid) [Blastomonas sp. RAC04]|nr:hypothetical protein BSY18_4081 [Blastomonas sp. RAC04]
MIRHRIAVKSRLRRPALEINRRFQLILFSPSELLQHRSQHGGCSGAGHLRISLNPAGQWRSASRRIMSTRFLV